MQEIILKPLNKSNKKFEGVVEIIKYIAMREIYPAQDVRVMCLAMQSWS